MTLQKDEHLDNQKSDSNTNNTSSLQYEQIKQMFDFWAEILKLPTIGPFSAYSKDAQVMAQKTGDIFQTVIRFQTSLGEYWSKINHASIIAVQNLLKSSPNKFTTKEDFENYRKIAIDAFENSFSSLFDSKEFAITYGKVFSDQLDLVKQIKDISEDNLKTLNIPTQTQFDELLRDVHDMKLRLRELEKALEDKGKKNGTRDTST